jgi:hypothetical protein
MVQNVSYAVSAVLALLGIVGFVNDPIAGIFEVGPVHNVILIVLGGVLAGAAYAGSARLGAQVVGVVTAIIAVLGFVPPSTTVIGIAETNTASSVLQAVVALVLLYVGFMMKEEGGGAAGPAGGRQQQPQQPNGPMQGPQGPEAM